MKIIAFIAIIIGLTACKKDTTPTYYFKGTIDGVNVSYNFTADENGGNVGSNAGYFIASDSSLVIANGTNLSNLIEITLSGNPIGIGTYTNTDTTSNVIGITLTQGNISYYSLNNVSSQPTITCNITAANNSNISGTLSGTLYKNGVAKTITNGSFNFQF